jgi:hypothetical protein
VAVAALVAACNGSGPPTSVEAPGPSCGAGTYISGDACAPLQIGAPEAAIPDATVNDVEAAGDATANDVADVATSPDSGEDASDSAQADEVADDAPLDVVEAGAADASDASE